MKNMTKRFFSLLLAFVMLLSVVPMTAFAAEHDHLLDPEVVVGDQLTALAPLVAAEAEAAAKDEIPDFSFASVLAPTLLSADEVVVDKENPEIQVFEAELSDLKVLGAEGDPVPLTAEQKATLVALYQQYVDHRNANADVLGVQVPFYLQYSDEADELGPLGEVLSLAGIPLEAVRAGMVAYADLEGMLVIFLYTDMLGIQFYGSAIKSARDEALQVIKDSGAKTEEQKLLVLNDWLAEVNTFDMPYIMGEDTMKAQNPQKHRYYDAVYDVLYDMYVDSIGKTFESNIVNGLKDAMKQQFYVEAIKAAVYQSAYSFDEEATYKDAYDKANDPEALIEAEEKKVYDEAYAAEEKRIWDEAYAKAEDEYAISNKDAREQAYKDALAEFKASEDYTKAKDAAAAEYKTTEAATKVSSEAYQAASKEYTDATEGKLFEEREAAREAAYDAAYKTAYDAYLAENVEEGAEATEEQKAAATEAATKAGTEAGTKAVADAADKYAAGKADEAVAAAAAEYGVQKADEAADKYATEKAESATAGTAKEEYAKAEADKAVEAAKADIDVYAKSIVNAKKAEIEAAAKVEAEAKAKEAADKVVADGKAAAEAAANAAVDGFMKENGAAIEADPVAFCEKAFGAEAAAQIAAQWEGFWADAEKNGIPGMIATFAAEIWPPVIEQFYIQGMVQQGMTEAAAKEQAAAIMKQDADKIAADPYAYCEEKFGAEGAAQAQAVVDDQLKKMGLDPSTETNPQGRVKLEVIVAMQMDTPQQDPMLQKPDGSYMTPNEAIPVFAEQAAPASTQGVLDFWEGSHFGALGEGKSVCLGYADAYAYLMQCMHPEYYTKSGNYKTASDWKTDVKELYYTNGQLDPRKGYFADLVRISFQTEVTMFGQVQEDFNSDHFWNAVYVNGGWYYVDPCYTDVYVEVMMRDRAETDGNINHMYFMFSHDSALSLYDGYYSELKTLYANHATDTRYEDSWMSRIISDTTFDGGYAYYVYSSSDLITILDDYNNDQMNSTEYDTNYEFKLVRHQLDTSDVGDGDNDYNTLIEFNHPVDEESDETVARVYNPSTRQLEENTFLTALYAQHAADMKVYPSLAITCAKSGNLVYFNLSNYLLAYDTSSGAIFVVKEYNSVSATRDKTNAFGAMAFFVVGESGGDLTVQDHPIAGIILKEDGKLYVSIATNFSYISGKETDDTTHATPDDPAANGEYGYEYEESNYNPMYNSFAQDDGMGSMMGYEQEINDNDEFMWTANFVETQNMSSVAVSVCRNHTYETVSVAANCEHNAYTVNMCANCGAVENGTYAEVADTIHNHHYVYFKETYYTKSSSNQNRWNSGECYVCTECGFSIEEPTEPEENAAYGDYGTSYEEQMEVYEKELAIWNNAKETVGHEYAPTDASWSSDNSTVTFSKLTCDHCKTRKPNLDCLLKDNTIETTLANAMTVEAAVLDYTGVCTEGATAIYGTSGKLDVGGTYTVSKEVKLAAGNHPYEIAATWNMVVDADGKAVLDANGNEQFTVDATLTCPICDDTYSTTGFAAAYDAEKSFAPACEELGGKVYSATIVVKNSSGKEVGSATTTHTVDIPATGHTFVDGICSVCGEVMLSDPEILSCYSKLQTSVKVTWTPDENADGYELWRTATPDDEESWALVKTVKDGAQDRYTNQGLEKGTTYYYKVRAYVEDAEGNKTYSNFSNVDYMPAAVVWDGPYSNATFRIRLRWNEIGGSHGYQIWRLNEDGETWNVVKTLGDKNNTLTDNQGATTAYSNTGLKAGEKYTYKIRAFCIPEEGKKVFGAYSDEFTIAVMPETPVITVTSPKAGRAQVEWDELNGAAGYQIWMNNTDSDAGWAIIKSVTDGSTTYTKSDLKSGTKYEFRVRAYTEVDGKKTFGEYSEVVTIKVK
ncbi:MAG: fibronectin type III domain-containing protein [Oscillospiraceae bacterium]|nr:fibronectin type III domain-containing protein [Oscillospiraceae bacterium]